MNTEDSEFERIEREQAMRGVPDAIHHTDTSETLEYITGWNDCRQAMLAAQQEPWLLESTQTLAKNLARKFYPEVTQWECLNDLAGVISQIDNMTTGLMRKPAQQEPVVFYRCNGCGHAYEQVHPTSCDCMMGSGFEQVNYYTAPQSQRKPLTKVEVDSWDLPDHPTVFEFAQFVEAKLKEKNNENSN